jgi:hydrogenase nickel incorporation protein HypA/HybF
MHELNVTKKTMDLIKSECKENNIKNPKKIFLELGELTTYKKEPLVYYYNILKKESDLLKNTDLIIKEIPGKIKCKDCKKESLIKELYIIICPNCRSGNVNIIQGQNIKINKIQTGEE